MQCNALQHQDDGGSIEKENGRNDASNDAMNGYPTLLL